MTARAAIDRRARPPAWRRDDRHAWLPATLMGTLILLMILPEGLDYDLLNTASAPASGGLVSRTLWLGLFALSVALISMRIRLVVALLRVLNPFLALFALLAMASLLWSIDPSLTARRLYRMITILLACVAFVLVGWHARRVQQVVRPVLTVLLLASVVFALAAPALAIHQESASELAGAWRGLANHKNGLGALACTALLLWVHAGLAREAHPLAALAGVTLAGACLVLSRSSTSMAAAVFGALFLVVSLGLPRFARRGLPALIVLLVAALLVYALGVLNLIPGSGTLMAPIAALSDKGSTLTGRTEIWAILSEHIARHPWLGTGYGAYWTAGPVMGTDAYEFVHRMGSFFPGSAHNGYLEVTNDLGGAGLAVLIGYILVHAQQTLKLLRIEPVQATLYLALFFQQAVTNLSETHWFSVLSIDFVVMTLASTALARALLEQRWRSTYGEPGAAVQPTRHAAPAWTR
jgi:exopolysaccharide production protein ExoQ